MTKKDKVIIKFTSQYEKYEVIDTIYNGRVARLLYTNSGESAQSGIALDGIGELLFDYNERFMELIRGLKPKSILIIGGGAFTLPSAINNEFPMTNLDVVELDKKLIAIATKYFDFKPNFNTNIFTSAGEHYLKKSNKKYDLIILDVFKNTQIPKEFQTEVVARDLLKNLNPSGVVAMNIIAAFYGVRSATLRRQTSAFEIVFSNIGIFPAGSPMSLWAPQNFIITASNINQDFNQYLRYRRIDSQQSSLSGMRNIIHKYRSNKNMT